MTDRQKAITAGGVVLAALALGSAARGVAYADSAKAAVLFSHYALSQPADADPQPSPSAGGSSVDSIATIANSPPAFDPPAAVAIVYTASWCGPCKAMEAECRAKLPGVGWTIGVGGDIRFVDGEAAGIATFPTVVVKRGKAETYRQAGAISAAKLADLLNEARTGRPSAVKAETPSAQQAADGCASCGSGSRSVFRWRWGRR